MKKIICAFLSFYFLMYMLPPVYAENGAKSLCVLEMTGGEIVYEKNAYEKLPMASTTKIMTAIVALENSSVEDVVTISEKAALEEGSSAYLEKGDKLTMLDLLYGLMLNSGNDAAVAIAEYIAGDENKFADMMNKKAWEIGAADTQFTNPNGLPDDYHYTTAYDLALIARYAMQNSDFKTIVSSKSNTALVINTGRTIDYYNHNKLLSTYDGCIGIKTGYTKTAGRCLVSAAERDNMSFIAVTLNDPSDWQDHEAIFDSCFSSYTAVKAAAQGEAADDAGTMVYANDVYTAVKNGDSPEFEIEAHIPKKLAAPVDKGEKVGYAEVFKNGVSIGRVDVCSAKTVYKTNRNTNKNTGKKTFFQSIYDALKSFLM